MLLTLTTLTSVFLFGAYYNAQLLNSLIIEPPSERPLTIDRLATDIAAHKRRLLLSFSSTPLEARIRAAVVGDLARLGRAIDANPPEFRLVNGTTKSPAMASKFSSLRFDTVATGLRQNSA